MLLYSFRVALLLVGS